MNANQIYSQLKAGQFREAFGSLQQRWQELRWELRLTIVATAVALLLIWILSEAGWLGGLLALPPGLCAAIAAARPARVLDWVDGFVRWADGKRQRALAKGTFFAKWVARPFYASLSGSASLTSAIKDPYFRAGATIALQGYAVYLALLLAYVAVYVMLVLICIAVALWILAYILSESGGGSRTVSRTVTRTAGWGMSGRSEEREDFLGNPYTQHYDDEGRAAGHTERREDFFGRPYQQHISPEGDSTGHSEEREGFFGDQYTQHFNEHGDSAGQSGKREDFFGRKYTQHFDEDGNSTGRSDEREDFLGRKYTRHDEE